MNKVLIVDDALFMRIALRKLLELNGYHVVGEAENGSQAVKLYQSLKPDIVTMDITMPVMGGVEALSEIIGIDPNAKIVMISAMGQESYVREAVLKGAKGFVVKPWNEEYLLRTINSLCE